MPPLNQAAFLPGVRQALRVSSAPYPTAKDHELIIRNRAVALNIIDVGIQSLGATIFKWLKFPVILGFDVAGEVVETGPLVKAFHIGDRVAAQARGCENKARQPDEGGFQHYLVVNETLTVKIPDSTSFEQACVLSLPLLTAACGLFEKEQLALDLPKLGKPKTGQTLLIWGASTSVGTNAVQLAAAAGYEVIATASKHNWDMVRGLGATAMFDYRSPTAVADITKALMGKSCVGALAIGQGSAAKCAAIIGASKDARKFVSQASAETPGTFPGSSLGVVAFIPKVLAATAAAQFAVWRSGVRAKFIEVKSSVECIQDRKVHAFVEQALREGSYKVAPEPKIIGGGLGKIQEGLDAVAKGPLSAMKIVVSL